MRTFIKITYLLSTLLVLAGTVMILTHTNHGRLALYAGFIIGTFVSIIDRNLLMKENKQLKDKIIQLERK